MDMAFIWGIIRHVLTMLGGILVTSGYLESDQVTQFVGAVVFLAMVVASAVNKIRQGKAVETALELPAGTSKETLKKEMKLK